MPPQLPTLPCLTRVPSSLAKEEEVIQLRSRVEELERENTDLSSTLVKKEQDLEAKTQEKEDLQGRVFITKIEIFFRIGI